MQLTREQKRITRRLKRGKNVRVTAVAGSGKTTSILGLVGAKMNILVLCYNNKLRAETQKRAQAIMDADEEPSEEPSEKSSETYSFDIHTFHSYCYNVLEEQLATTDLGIIKINDAIDEDPRYLANNHENSIVEYDLIVCDEAQDLNEVYYKFLLSLLRYTGAKLCLIGDPRQAIYQFNGSNEKYLLDAPIYFDREFVDLTLSQSFRLTEPIATFINGMYEDTLMTPKIVSKKQSDIKPMVMHHSVDVKQIAKFIKGFPPGDVLVLMYSVKRMPFKSSVKLANELMQRGVPVTFGNIADNQSDGSVLMLSYHQSKGLERPVVIIMDFNGFYFEISGDSHEKLPNLWYVAMSRASECLVIHTEVPFKFINDGLTSSGLKVSGKEVYSLSDKPAWSRNNKKSFDDFVRYTPSNELWSLIKVGTKFPTFSCAKDKCLRVTPGSILERMITDYLRRPDRKMKPDKFAEDYLHAIRGGINYRIEIGTAHYDGYDNIDFIRVLEIMEDNLRTMIKTCGIKYGTLKTIKMDLGNFELFDPETETMIIVAVDPWCLDTRIRWSTAKRIDRIMDVIACRISNVLEDKD